MEVTHNFRLQPGNMKGRVDAKGAGEVQTDCHRVDHLGVGKRTDEPKSQLPVLHP